jgi:ABC-type glycerol-3-phosphate transport system substrate-binding protein
MHGANRNRLLAEGLLEDLLPLMAYDIEMPLDTILPGILQAMDYKRGVYIVPAYFYTTSLKIYVSDQTLLRFARELPQPFDWDGFMTFFIPEKERLKLFCVLPVPLGTLTGMLTDEYYPYFYDYETNEYRFDNYVFREILHTVKTLYTLGMVLDDDSSDTFLYGAEGGMLLPSPVSIKDISDYGQFIMRGIDGYFPMPTIRGAEGMAVSMGMEFAVSVNAQNKTAAWEFIKILLSEEIQNSVYLYDFQPVAATLNTQAVNRARGKPPNYDLSNEEWDRYNRERRAFFAGIDRVKGGNGAPDVTDIILKYAIRFYRDEAELDNIIADLQQEADARLGAVFE